MNATFRWVLCCLFMFVFSATALNADDMDSTGRKVLIISSYGSDYQWSNNVISGFKDYLDQEHLNVDINVEYLTSEIFVNPHVWVERIQTIIDNYESNKPAMIVLISDEAWMGYRGANISAYKNIPIVLSAIKPLTIDIDKYRQIKPLLTDFTLTQDIAKQMGNVTGILREVNIADNIKLMERLLPEMTEIAFITDDRFYGIYSQLLARKAMEQHPKLTAKYYDGRYITTDSLINAMSTFQPTTGVMLTSWLTGKHGYEYSKIYLYKKMHDILQTPIFITNNIGMERSYFIGGYFLNSVFWGTEAAKTAVRLLHGEEPSRIPLTTSIATTPLIDYKELDEFGISANLLPKGAIILNKPESVLSRYKIEITIIALFIILIMCTLAIVSRAYMRLRGAQNYIMSLNEQTQQTNLELSLSRRHLEIALDKVQESDRMKSAFLANMSHEIRTPLNAIIGFSELVCSEYPDNESLQQYKTIISQNSSMLLQLVNDVLDLSSIESGAYSFRFTSVSLSEIVNNTIASYGNKAKPGVKVIADIPDSTYCITTDEKRLYQVYANFFSNALKFTDSGSVTIGFKMTAAGDTYIFVRDTGCGIANHELKNVFERFVKLNNFEPGTGLGLPICKEIVERLGGKIGVESELDKGSSFWASIPQ